MVNFAVLANQTVVIKESEKIDNYSNLAKN